MSTLTPVRRGRLRRMLAGATATGVVAGVALLIPATPAHAADAGSVTVSKTEFTISGQHEVTVTGAGFDPDLATGTRPPLAGSKSGAYIVFGKFATDWKPSDGAPGASRKSADLKWALPAESTPVPAFNEEQQAQRVELKADGTFTATLTIDKAAADAAATDPSNVNYGVYTYAGSGAVVASYETYTPITFVADPVAPATTTADIKIKKVPTTKKKGKVVLSVTGGTTPATGAVKVVYKGGKLKGKKIKLKKDFTLGADGTVKVKLPKSAKGKRTLKVKYKGDALHQASAKVKTKVKVKK